MKIYCKITYTTLLFLLAFSCMLGIKVSAEDVERTLDTEIIQCSEEEILERTNRLSLRSLETSSESYKNKFVFSFDVSEDEECVMLFNNAIIVVCDSEGNTTNVLKFNKDVIQTRERDAIIKWSGENLELVLEYGITYYFSTNGELLDVWRYEGVSDISNPQSITCNGHVYKLKNNNTVSDLLGAGDHSMLVKESSNGTETIIFKSTASLPFTATLFIGIACGIVMFGIFILVSMLIMFRILTMLKRNTGDGAVCSDKNVE